MPNTFDTRVPRPETASGAPFVPAGRAMVILHTITRNGGVSCWMIREVNPAACRVACYVGALYRFGMEATAEAAPD